MSSAAKPTERASPSSWPPGGGIMGRRIREYDWSKHPLGPPEDWPQSLRTTISIMLGSRYAMWMGWGPEFWFFCNDAYLPTVGIKESWVLGASARKVWEEIWADIGPRAESVVQTGEATWDEGLKLILERSGFAEETYHTFSYSPIPDDNGGIGGMLCVVTEETERVIGERRLELLRDLAASLAGLKGEAEMFAAVQWCFETHAEDLPIVLAYLFEGGGSQARLVSASGVAKGAAIAPEVIEAGDESALWPLDRILHRSEVLGVAALREELGDLPAKSAVIVRLFQNGVELPVGFLVVGTNPFRPFDFGYQGFIDLLAGQITAALSNLRAYEQERQRAESLAELDRAKTAFFSNVSHEFRTPLTLMLGPIEDMLHPPERAAKQEPRALAEVAHRNGLRLLKLVNTLLDFSRLEAGRLEAAFEPLDLAALTRDLAGSFRSAIEKAGLKLVVDCPPLAETVYADRDLWEKIVLNLLSNAFKFTLEGRITVSLREAGEFVELRVEDTGAGIPEEALSRLFERFYRVQGAVSRSHEGSGIGLALVSELANLHGGRAEVESEEGRGSVFKVFVRRGSDHLPRENLRHGWASKAKKVDATFIAEMGVWSAQASPRVSTGNAEGDCPRVLVADDNADMRDYVSGLLVPHFEVIASGDGEAALEVIRSHPPDLVLSDVMMPKLDGFGLVAAIRANPKWRTIPVILLSARAGDGASVEGLNAGADDYLVKPFSARELVARVTTHLTLARMRREAASQVYRAENKVQHLLSLLPAAVYACDGEGKITFFNQKAEELWGRTPLLNSDEEKFCACYKVFLPDGAAVPPDRTPMAVAVRNGQSLRNVEAEVERPDGTRFTASVSVDPLRDEEGRVIGAINVFQDITEAKKTERELAGGVENLKRRNERMQLLSETQAQLLGARDPDTVVRELFCRVAAHLNADTYFNFMVDEKDGALHLHSCAGIPEETARSIQRLEYGQAICGTVAQTRQPITANDIQNTDYDKADLVRGFGIQTYACNPLIVGGRLLGTLSFASRTRARFADDELEFIRVITHSAAMVLDQLRSTRRLKETAERLGLAMAASHMGDWSWDLKSDRATLSAAAAEIMGLPAGQEVTFAKIAEMLHADDRERAREALAEAVRTGNEYALEVRMPAGGKSVKWLAVTARPVLDADGAVTGMLGVLQNVTARKEDEETRSRFAAIVKSSEDAILSKDLNGTITSWNEGAERIFGYTEDEVVGRPVTLLIPPERLSEEEVILERVRRSEPIEHYETVRRRKDGTLVDVSLTISPLRDAHGTLVGASKIARDITEKKRMDAELLRREQLYRSIGESINYGIWVTDGEGRNLYASDSFLKLVGLTQEQVSDFGWTAVLHPDDAAATVAAWRDRARDGTFWEREHRFKGVDGCWHPVLARGVPVRNESGEIVRWVGINLDIATFKKTEEALRQQSTMLAVLNRVSGKLVAERNLENIVHSVIDAGREASGAAFGAFLYRTKNERDETVIRQTLSGVDEKECADHPLPNNKNVFDDGFLRQGLVRIGDAAKAGGLSVDAPYRERTSGGAPVRSYVAVPVVSNSGEVLGGMFFSHPDPDAFNDASEGILRALAAQAAIAMDNAGLYNSLQRELDQVKRVESALRGSEARWRELAEAMPHLVWTCTPDGSYDFVSPQWCAYTGRTEAEQLGFGWADSIHPDDQERLEAEWNRAAHGRGILDMEMRIRGADGSYRWFKIRAVPVKDKADNILKWYGSNTDIEDLKRTDIALREREAHWSAIFAQAGSGIIQTDLEGRILMVNDAYCEIVARTREQLLGMRVHDITHPEDLPLTLAPFEDMMRGGPAFIIEKRDLRPDGAAVWVRNSVVGIRDNQGRVTAGLTIAQDITDSREAEDALRASEEQLRLVTDHAPVLLAQLDRKHRFKFVNQPYAERYGYEPRDVIGKAVWEIVGGNAYAATLDKIDLAFTGQRVEFEIEIPYQSMGTRWGHVIYVPERAPDGEIVGIVSVITDITMRKQAEKELEQARDRALAAVRAKDDFLARLSHELRTPLSPVLLLASEGASNNRIPDSARADFEIIRKNVDLEARLIDDLLDLTRITRGKLKLDLHAADIHAVLRDAIATMRSEAVHKNIQLDLRLDAPGHRVTGDAVRLQQVFWNLLNNSVKFTPSGGTIRIETKASPENDAIVIEVSDTGIGMTGDELNRIFDAFSQGDHADTGGPARFGGLGLGLAITRMLVDLHHGQIRAASSGRGQGATFSIELPLLAENDAGPPKSAGKGPAKANAQQAAPDASAKVNTPLRILLVEDHEPTRAALSSLLGRRKHKVAAAGSLAEARAIFEPGKFDLIVSDIGLPDGNGYELMAEWRDVPGLRGIALSGYGMEHDVSRSWEAGFSSHLTKPVKMETLDHAIAEAMAK